MIRMSVMLKCDLKPENHTLEKCPNEAPAELDLSVDMNGRVTAMLVTMPTKWNITNDQERKVCCPFHPPR